MRKLTKPRSQDGTTSIMIEERQETRVQMLYVFYQRSTICWEPSFTRNSTDFPAKVSNSLLHHYLSGSAKTDPTISPTLPLPRSPDPPPHEHLSSPARLL